MALQHEAPLQSVLKFFSVSVIPAFCDNSQKPMSVSEEELEKGHLAPEPEEEKTCIAGPWAGLPVPSRPTHGAQLVDFKVGMSLAQRDCPVQKESRHHIEVKSLLFVSKVIDHHSGHSKDIWRAHSLVGGLAGHSRSCCRPR